MASTSNISTHRHREDWCSMGIGAAILISPVIAQTMDRPFVTLNAVAVGLLVMLLAWQELMLPETWEEYLEVAFGLWLAISPWVIGYSDDGLATVMHVALGGAVAALGVVEFCQDWPTTRQAQ
jgi:hypothetical protein